MERQTLIFRKVVVTLNAVILVGLLLFSVDPPHAAYAGITSPPNGSTFASATVSFYWANANANEYWLYIGTAVGGNNLYSASQELGLSRTVSNLPTNGAPVYVRLWSRFGASWYYNDYSYIAYTSQSANPAAITSPPNGATFSSNTVSFFWTNTGAAEYWLYVGTTAGGYDVFSSSQGTNTSRTVSNLPTNGTRLYVRLWSGFGASWYFRDYDYLAFRAAFPDTALNSTSSSSAYARSPLNVFAPNYTGQCTWYVYGRVMELADLGYLPSIVIAKMKTAFDPNLYAGQRNANQWPDRLQGKWISTSQTSPLPLDRRRTGLLAVYPGPVPNGHVGFVEEVSSDRKRYRMSQFNRMGDTRYLSAWYYFNSADVPANSSQDANGSLGGPKTTVRYYPSFQDPSDPKW